MNGYYGDVNDKIKALQNTYIGRNPLLDIPKDFYEKQERVLKTEDGAKLYQALSAYEHRCFQEWLYQTNPKAQDELRKYIKGVDDIDAKLSIKAEHANILKEKDDKIEKLMAEFADLKKKLGE